jgi:hypothetical protein
MKQALFTNAARVAAVGTARHAADRGFCAYPWQLGRIRLDQSMARIDVITETKLHSWWPGDPSS